MENLLAKLKIYKKPEQLQHGLIKEVPEGAHFTVTSRGRIYLRKEIVDLYKLMSYAPSFGYDKKDWFLIIDDNPETSFNVSSKNDSYFIHCNDLANRLINHFGNNRINLLMVPTEIPTIFKLDKTEKSNRSTSYTKEQDKPFNQPKTLLGHEELIKSDNYYDNIINHLLRPSAH